MEHLLADSATAGLTRTVKGALYIDLEGVPVPPSAESGNASAEDSASDDGDGTLADALKDEGEPLPPARFPRFLPSRRRCSSRMAKTTRRSIN